MILEVVVKVVQQQLLLLLLLHLRDHANVEVHHERSDLAGLPVFPQPAWDVEQDCLQSNA